MSGAAWTSGSRPAAPARALRRAVLAPIVVYQRVISPAIPRRCKYEPTCSRYAAQAISRYGVMRGLVLAAWRLLRCNPFSYGGYDPVEAQRLFNRRRRGARERASAEPGQEAAEARAPARTRGDT